jgi:hypothetical protein
MRKVVPVVVYTDGRRQVVGEATVEVGDYSDVDFPLDLAEINLNNAGLSIRKDVYVEAH